MKLGRTLIAALVINELAGCQTLRIEIQLQETHRNALAQHQYISDQEQYGVFEYWTPSLTGDCEDYALWMQAKVGGTLLYVRTPEGQAHIVLEQHGFIIDNTSKFIYPRERMAHKFVYALKPQHIASYLKMAQENTHASAYKSRRDNVRLTSAGYL